MSIIQLSSSRPEETDDVRLCGIVAISEIAGWTFFSPFNCAFSPVGFSISFFYFFCTDSLLSIIFFFLDTRTWESVQMSGIAQPNRADEVQSVSQLHVAMICTPPDPLFDISDPNMTCLASESSRRPSYPLYPIRRRRSPRVLDTEEWHQRHQRHEWTHWTGWDLIGRL